MKTNLLTAAVLAGLAVLSVASAKADSLTYTSGSVLSGDTFTDLSIAKFNTSLGTLTGVTVTIDFSTLQGSFTVTNDNPTLTAKVNAVTSALAIQQSDTNDLGFSTVNRLIGTLVGGTVVTTPDWKATTLAKNGGQATFTIGDGQNFVTAQSASIDLVYWGAYQSTDGSGNVVFQAQETNPITATGGDYRVASTNTKANTKMSVTYTFDAIPEPATLALFVGGIGMLVIGQRIRRRSR